MASKRKKTQTINGDVVNEQEQKIISLAAEIGQDAFDVFCQSRQIVMQWKLKDDLMVEFTMYLKKDVKIDERTEDVSDNE